jgi:hypothetical protein
MFQVSRMAQDRLNRATRNAPVGTPWVAGAARTVNSVGAADRKNIWVDTSQEHPLPQALRCAGNEGFSQIARVKGTPCSGTGPFIAK